MKQIFALVFSVLIGLSSSAAFGFEPDTSDKMQLAVASAILDLTNTDPGVQAHLDEAAGYAVFPSVGKAGIGIGGARGTGLVIVDGEVDGKTTLTQLSYGLQLGAQAYAQFILFKDDAALAQFRRGNFEMGAQASAVAVTAGASADANYDKGVAVFTNVSGGLMYEASISGQKFKYEPIED